MNSQPRRGFLKSLLGAGASAAFAPMPLARSASWHRVLDTATAQTPDEHFWELVANQFPIRSGYVMMNAANLCPAPYPVIDAVERLTRSLDGDVSFQNRAKFNGLREEARQRVAAHVGANPNEIALTRNTSEGNNTVVNGLELGSGDNVVIWDQNHPTNNVAWDVRAERHGFTVTRVRTPDEPKTAEDLVQPFAEALSPGTKAMAFSHVSNVTGITLPARALSELARARGVSTLVDGAQAMGVLALDLHDLGCDFYTASSHKWLLGPKEAGVLYVRGDRVSDLWAMNVGVGWQSALEHGAQKFDVLGQRDDACVAAVGTAMELHQAIGADRVEARVRAIVDALKVQLRSQVPGMRFQPEVDSSMSAGVLICIPPRGDIDTMYEALYRDHHIASAKRGIGIRLSPHIYNTMAQVARVADAFADVIPT